MESISAKLYSHDQYKKDEHTHLIFELTNHTKQPLHILKWNTPLEGLKSDCLSVNKNGKRVSYDGLLIKRGQPGPAAADGGPVVGHRLVAARPDAGRPPGLD